MGPLSYNVSKVHISMLQISVTVIYALLDLSNCGNVYVIDS